MQARGTVQVLGMNRTKCDKIPKIQPLRISDEIKHTPSWGLRLQDPDFLDFLTQVCTARGKQGLDGVDSEPR